MGKWFENDVKPWFSEKNWTWDGIKEGLGSSFDSAIEGVKSIWNGFAEWLNSILKFEIPEVDIPLVGKVGGFTMIWVNCQLLQPEATQTFRLRFL